MERRWWLKVDVRVVLPQLSKGGAVVEEVVSRVLRFLSMLLRAQ